ncbi:rhomboid family protein [Aridibaculum aurantiacum]|uniref:rhomboid family protein n=1 Tax=Aridibaculum aurantiacum TaxID=2810307 RepID=UPI001A967392|nr:rhomboid family intramembrane serine protease [Aridibaculum aurantiacum]
MIPISTIILIITVLVSYKGLKDHSFYDRYCFKIAPVIHYKDYKRIITSAFLHVSWMHLIFNMVALYFFSSSVELALGPVYYLIIYFSSIIGGNLLSMFIHRHHDSYSAAGASGAICGVIFAAIAIIPGMSVGLFLLPFSMPGWLFGLIYVAVSIYGIRSRRDNIGHDAHLGGGLTGMFVAIALHPSVITTNIVTILIVAVPAIAFILFIIYKPEALLVDNMFYRSNSFYTADDKYNLTKKQKQQALDDILEKIHKKGMNSLTAKEKMLLKEYSEKA